MLSKKQALDLIKVLSHYFTLGDTINLVDVDLQGLISNLESHVLDDSEGNPDYFGYQHPDDDDDDDSDEDEELEGDSEVADQLDDQEDEDYEEDSEVLISERSASLSAELKLAELVPVPSADFHNLRGLPVTVVESPRLEEGEELELEFESDESEENCDVLLDGQPQSTLKIIRRDGCDIYVSETNEDESTPMEWHHFVTSKMPKQWAKLLPNGKFIVVGST